MKATINGVMVEGSPQEISEFMKLQEAKVTKEIPKSHGRPYEAPYKPLELPKSPYPWNQPSWVIDLNKTMSWNQG